MANSRWRNFGIVLRRVLRTPKAAVTLTVSLMWSLALLISLGNAWGLLPALVGLALIGAMTLSKLQDEEFIRDAIRENRESERSTEMRDLEFRLEELDVEARVRMKSIVRLQQEIARSVESSPIDEVAVGLADTVASTEALVGRGMELARRRRDLVRFLRQTEDGAIRQRISSLESQLADEQDAARRQELQVALDARRQELTDYSAIASAANGILTELDTIEASFSGLRAKLVRIQSTDIQEWVAANTELADEVRGLSTAVDVLEESVNEAMSVQGFE